MFTSVLLVYKRCSSVDIFTVTQDARCSPNLLYLNSWFCTVNKGVCNELLCAQFSFFFFLATGVKAHANKSRQPVQLKQMVRHESQSNHANRVGGYQHHSLACWVFGLVKQSQTFWWRTGIWRGDRYFWNDIAVLYSVEFVLNLEKFVGQFPEGGGHLL